MAMDLRARLRLDGSQFSRSMNQIQRQMQQANRQTNLWRDSQGRLRDDLGRFARQTNSVSNSMHSMGRAFTSPIRAIGNLSTSLGGLVGAYAAASGAKKVFEETIGQAAKYEQSTVMISAMLNDKKLGQDYMKLVDKFAVDSPILDSQGMLGNSKSFLTASKDMKQLEKMWSLAERMAAIDPYQGLEGAVFALRELFSGDAISIVRRFEMPKKVMNEIKKMDLDDQLRELDKYFNKIGMTQQLIDDMGGTTLGVWAQIKEQANVILRTMGQPALMKVKEFLNGVKSSMASVKDVMANRNFFTPEEFKKNLDRAMMFERFRETGSKILDNVMTGFISAAKGIGGWIESLSNNPEFLKLTTLQAKIGFVFEDIYGKFKEWLDGGGQTKINGITKDLLEIMATGLIASQQVIVDAALVIGKAVGSAMISSASSSFAEWSSKMMDKSIFNNDWFVGLKPIKWAHDGGMALREKVWGSDDKKAAPKKNGGLSRVPYNGYTASLHKDEMVLTRGEAAEYRSGKSGGGITIAKLADQIVVREEADIDKIANRLARLIEMEGAQMA